jgi:hypothetical protein
MNFNLDTVLLCVVCEGENVVPYSVDPDATKFYLTLATMYMNPYLKHYVVSP